MSTSTIDRREAIRRAALLAGVAIAPDWLDFAVRAQTPAVRMYFNPTQAAIVSAAAERILPRTDTPGAIDVGVPAFIERFYGEFMNQADKQLLVSLINDIETTAKTLQDEKSFTSLTAAKQADVLRVIATMQEQGKDPSSFGLLRSVTILGYFTSEQVGKNVLHYDPVPGAYDGCLPIDQVGRRNWTS